MRAPSAGEPGDLYVLVRIHPDPRFVREGNDLFTTVDLTMTQAALGAKVQVPTLGGDVELEFEPGTQPGEIRVLRGRGMPVLQGFGRGDQRVLVNVQVPLRLSDERALLQDFERKAGDEAYQQDEGFFEKLKSAFREPAAPRGRDTVSPERAEIARGLMIELFPRGSKSTRPRTGSSSPPTRTAARSGSGRPSARCVRRTSTSAGRTAGARSTGRFGSARSGSALPGSIRLATRPPL